jgi:peptide/nickel transport system permease protein
MPAPPPDQVPGALPDRSSLFAESGDMATEVAEIADGDAHALAALHDADPDQVPLPRARRRIGPAFWIASGWVALVTLAALLAPVLPLDDPERTVALPRQAPSVEHWFGTDALGRDIFSRTIWGGRISLVVGVGSILLGLLVGGLVGLVAGYRRGRVERVLMGAMDVLLSFPALLLALAIVGFRDERTVPAIVLAIGVVSIAPVARLVRANTLVHAQREYVTAARSLGAGDVRVVLKEILPNVVPPVLSFAVIAVAVAIVAEGGLAFLGLSVPPPTPTWGGMIADGRALLSDAAWISMMPCLVMFLTVLALNLAGDRLREHHDVREQAL